ncbi:nucleolysin tiar [Hordeum vulgare]|nr:nucleolysin tiar [Hordeum vulgare]
MPEQTSAPPKAPPRKAVRKISASGAEQRASAYVRKGKVVAKDAPAKKAAAARITTDVAEAEAARNRPPPVAHLRTQAEQMTFLVSTVQGMEKNIQEIMQNKKSLERVVETKFHNMDVKVTELTTIVIQLQHEVDSVEIPRSKDEYEDDDDEDESPPPTTTQFNKRPQSVVVPAPETGHTSSTQA